MDGIIRQNLDDAFANECAYSEVVEAGDLVFLNFCVGNKGKYPARKTVATEFAHKGGENGLQVQIDAIAYKGH